MTWRKSAWCQNSLLLFETSSLTFTLTHITIIAAKSDSVNHFSLWCQLWLWHLNSYRNYVECDSVAARHTWFNSAFKLWSADNDFHSDNMLQRKSVRSNFSSSYIINCLRKSVWLNSILFFSLMHEYSVESLMNV